jgi:hypothetical protein
MGEPESGAVEPQTPEPPPPLTLAREHDASTAETGIAGQFPKEAALLWMLRFQGRCGWPVVCQLMDAMLLPVTTGESGLAALNVIVAGVTVTTIGPPHDGVATEARSGGGFGPEANNRRDSHAAVSIKRR